MIFRDGAILIATLLAVATADAQNPGATPVLKLFLPASVASEQVDVDYALYGAFGAYSNFNKAKPDSQFVEIPLAVQASIAQEIKFSMGTAKIDPAGRFEINLPDFESDPECKRPSVVGGFQFGVLESDTWDRDLVPQSEHLRTLEGELKPASDYADPILFIARKPS